MRRITKKERIKLLELMRTNENYLIRKRAHFLFLKSKNYNKELLQRIFEVSDETICNWLSNWNSLGINSLIHSDLFFAKKN